MFVVIRRMYGHGGQSQGTGAMGARDEHEVCKIIRSIIPGDGCATLTELAAAARMLGVSAGELVSRDSCLAPRRP